MALGAAVRFRERAHQRGLDQAKLEVREQLARDLHDTVGHHVSAIAIGAQAGWPSPSGSFEGPKQHAASNCLTTPLPPLTESAAATITCLLDAEDPLEGFTVPADELVFGEPFGHAIAVEIERELREECAEQVTL